MCGDSKRLFSLVESTLAVSFASERDDLAALQLGLRGRAHLAGLPFMTFDSFHGFSRCYFHHDFLHISTQL